MGQGRYRKSQAVEGLIKAAVVASDGNRANAYPPRALKPWRV